MIKENHVVAMTYVLKDENRIILDASVGRAFAFIQGKQNIIPGLEKQMLGLKVGDKKSFVVKPEEAYGQYDPNLKITLTKEQFGDMKPQVGQQLQLNAPNGQPFVATVVNVQESQVIMDANHPLAGKTLYFDIDILAIRDATSQELEKGLPEEIPMG